jgi:FixJ family two-component response regulator
MDLSNTPDLGSRQLLAVLAIADYGSFIAAAAFLKTSQPAVAFASAEGFLSSRQIPRTSCLITDVQMPGMTGLELHRRLLAAGKTIPTILITAYPDDSAREGALGDGVVCYLSKPFDENELLACIDKSLNT